MFFYLSICIFPALGREAHLIFPRGRMCLSHLFSLPVGKSKNIAFICAYLRCRMHFARRHKNDSKLSFSIKIGNNETKHDWSPTAFEVSLEMAFSTPLSPSKKKSNMADFLCLLRCGFVWLFCGASHVRPSFKLSITSFWD